MSTWQRLTALMDCWSTISSLSAGVCYPFLSCDIKSQNVNALVRNGWLCACFSSFREPGYSRAPTWIRWKVCIWLSLLLDTSPIQGHSSYLAAGHSLKAVFHVHISNSSHRKNTFIPFIRIHRPQLIQRRSFGLEVCITHDFKIYCLNSSILFPEGRMLGGCRLFPALYLLFIIDPSCYKAHRSMPKCSST